MKLGLANPFRPRLRSVVFTHRQLHGRYLCQKRGTITVEDMLVQAAELMPQKPGETRMVKLDPADIIVLEVW